MITTSLVPRPYYVGGRAGTTGRDGLGDHAGTKSVLTMKPSGTTGTTGTPSLDAVGGVCLGTRIVPSKTAPAAVLGEITPPLCARCGAGRRCFVVDTSLPRTTKRLINDNDNEE